VLWLAFGETRAWAAGFLVWASYALGATNLLTAYVGSLPIPTLVLSLSVPALLFAGSVMGARHVARSIGPLSGVIAFSMLWAASDYLMSQGRDGSIISPAYSQIAMPCLIQGASVFGIWFITFVMGFVSAGVAISLRRRAPLPAILAILLFVTNAGFGVWRISEAANAPATRIGLAVDDSLGRASFSPGAAEALGAVDAYVDAAHKLAAQGATLIVFPEKLAILTPQWRNQALAKLSAASNETRSTIIIGFDDRGQDRLNDALIFTPDAAQPETYIKRHFVPVWEDGFKAGTSNMVLSDRTGIAICKDMDYPAMLRRDQRLGHPTLLAVPAYDFDTDRYFHARSAIMRGVEDGFALARASKEGLLTLTDATGRMIAMKRSTSQGMVMLVGDLARGPGDTIYVHIGDVFAWGCLACSISLLGLCLHKTRGFHKTRAQPGHAVLAQQSPRCSLVDRSERWT
jgi:apolipoprotein N-acyltransferase